MRPISAIVASLLALLWTQGAAGVSRRVEQNGAIRWIATPPSQTPAFFARLAAAGIEVPPNDRPFGRSVAFLVGVSRYKYLQPQLPGVARDIADLRDTLLEVSGFDEVIELTDEYATRDTIESFLVDEFRSMDRKDRLFIYLAGHGADAGGTTGYFQLQNARPNVYAMHTLRIGDAVEWSALIPAHHLLVVFDACASGFAFERRAGSPQDEELDAVNTFSGKGSRSVITAGTGNEDTIEVKIDGDRPTGAFTRSFINALRQSHSRFLILTTERVFAETSDHLVSLLNSIDGPRMTPRKWDLDTTSYGGQFLFLNPTRRKEDVVSPSILTALHARVTDPQPALPDRPVASWKELSVRLGDVRLQSSRYGINLGQIPATESTDLVLQVTNEAQETRTISIRVDDPAIEASWEGGTWVQPVDAGSSGSLRIRVLPSTQNASPPRSGGGITFLSGGSELASITLRYQAVAPLITKEAHSGDKQSGAKKSFSSPYELCLGPAPAQYTLVAESARFWLTGDRSCGAWSTCDWTRRDDANVCFRFTLQGHDEFLFESGIRMSEGHLSAEYQLVRQPPRLTNLSP